MLLGEADGFFYIYSIYTREITTVKLLMKAVPLFSKEQIKLLKLRGTAASALAA